jgi:heme/copper-type cytochrome/quinol oxidase subunit 3
MNDETAWAGRRDTLDVSHLPTHGFSHRSPMWWGTLGMMAIEGTVFALTIMTYFYLRSHSKAWPMGVLPPDLLWGSVFAVVTLLSAIPNQLAKKAGERYDVAGVRLWLGITIALGLAMMVIRCFEFAALNVRWDSNAYGSVVWVLLGFHTAHVVTDWVDSVVLELLFFTGPLEPKRFVDVSENSLYWYFVVLAWIPIYFVIYWGARAT